MEQYLVIYYQAEEYKTKFHASETPDSSQPHMWGLEDDCEVVAVISNVDPAVSHVWIDESEVKPSTDEE